MTDSRTGLSMEGRLGLQITVGLITETGEFLWMVQLSAHYLADVTIVADAGMI